jgi:hypothetical protein
MATLRSAKSTHRAAGQRHGGTNARRQKPAATLGSDDGEELRLFRTSTIAAAPSATLTQSSFGGPG